MAFTYAYEDNGNTIKQTRTDTVTGNVTITKYNKFNTSITISTVKNLLEISDLRGSACAEYDSITAPTSTDIEDLCDQLNEWLKTPAVSATVVIPPGISTEAKQDTQITNQGAAGAAAPFGSGMLGWLRGIWDRLNQFTFTGGDLNVNASIDTTGLATEAKQDTQITNQGTEGATPPTIVGTGIIGYLRAIYDRLAQTFAFTGDRLKVDANITGGSGAPFLIFGTTTPLGASATFASGILSLVGKSQVETRVLSDTDGTLVFDFYEDAGGTDLVRSLSIPYVGGSGYQYFAAPAFSNYVEYSFVNSGTPQTDFLYETKVLETAISGQIVRLDGTIVSGMVAPVTRSVVSGITPLGAYQNVRVTSAGSQHSSIYDQQGDFSAIVDPNGSLKTGEVMVLCGGVLSGVDLSSILWQELSINGGSRTPGQGEQRISTGTNPDGGYILQSRKKARFIITQFNINHIGVQLLQADLEDPNTVFEWGSVDLIDDAGALNGTPNGLCLRVTGAVPPTDPTWEIVTIKDGVETVTDSSLWNGPQASLLNKRPNLSVYETRYNAGTGLFYQGPNFLHRVAGLIQTYAATYDFPVAIRVQNINGNTNDRSVATRALGTYRLGEERGELIPRTFTSTQLVKTGAGYVGKASLSRAGSGGGAGTAILYDGTDATGIQIGRLDVGGDDVKSITLDGSYSNGLYITIAGSGTNSLTVNFE